jgi:hypothetical protein
LKKLAARCQCPVVAESQEAMEAEVVVAEVESVADSAEVSYRWL